MKQQIFNYVLYMVGMILAMATVLTAFGILLALRSIDVKATILGLL